MSLDDPIEVLFGQPLDPFGNPVDSDGNSLDPSGRPFDPRGYLMRGGRFVADPQRDRVFTGRLAGAVAAAYRRDTILYTTHLVAAALHRRTRAAHPGLDLYRRLLLPEDARSFPRSEVVAELDALLAELRARRDAGQGRLGSVVGSGSAEEVLRSGLEHFARYHSKRAVAERDEQVLLSDPRLALYYANRLEGLGLAAPRSAGAAS